jgi:DNA-binding transcriptional regulator YhcF (GntR family)
LQDAGVIDNKRGIGFFVTDNAVELIREKEKKEFFSNELPDFSRKVELLKLTEQDLSELLNLIRSNSK